MEQLILKVLGFDVSNPTTIIFLSHICVHCNVSLKVMYLAMVIYNIYLYFSVMVLIMLFFFLVFRRIEFIRS
jgi:hypothetical protein